MQKLGLSFVVILLISSVFGSITVMKNAPQKFTPAPPRVDLCPFCFEFMDEAIDELLNAILNGGVLGGCNELCSYLSNDILQTGCNLICDYVGIEAFIDAINVTDPDPIYACQEVDVCPIVNGGMVKSNSIQVAPQSGPAGTTFTITYKYTVQDPTGPGLLGFNVNSPDAMPWGDAEFTEGQADGMYGIQIPIQAQPSEQEPFNAGIYQVFVFVCEGDCTTDHPYGGVYAQSSVNFTITQ